MKSRMVVLLLTAVLLAACGLNNVAVSVDEPTIDTPSSPEVVTVVVVVTSTPESIMTPTPELPQEGAASFPTPTDEASLSNERVVQTPATDEPQLSLPSGSWHPISSLPRYINALVVDPQNPQQLFAGTGSAGSGSGVYKSIDSGLTWQFASAGLPNEDVVALVLSSAQPPLLFALVGVRGDVYASNDEAQNWSYIGNSGLFGGFEHSMYADPANDNVLFALAKSGDLVRSGDGGQTWLPFGEGLPRDENNIHVLSLALDPTNPRNIYAGTGGFVGGGQGVYKSADGGQSWAAVNQGMLDYRVTALAIDSTSPQTVFAGTDDGTLFKTVDGGQTWENLSAKLPLPRNSYPTIQEIVFVSPNKVFLLVDRAGVFTSQDGGQTWQALGKPGDVESEFSAMVIVSNLEPNLVIGARRDGCWQYEQK